MKKLFLLAAVVASALTLTACGGGGDDAPLVATDNVTLPINTATGANLTNAVRNQAFTFNAAVPEFGTTGTTTVTVTDRPPGAETLAVPAANPGFTITSNNGTASGLLEFGSCRFRVTSSTFTSGPLVVGAIVTVQRCEIALGIDGTPADSVARTRSARLLLNNAISQNLSVSVFINNGGQITLNGNPVGAVTLEPLTGG